MVGEQLVELWRGDILESAHAGHAVICGPDGAIEASWGDPETVILPRSACKMIQALPLVESGAAAVAGLDARHLALACASHQGSTKHVALVSDWLQSGGFQPNDLLCGAQSPWDRTLRNQMIREDAELSPIHNNCSGKHAGFLTLTKHLTADADYLALSHPIQKAAKAALEEESDVPSAGYGIDGCSAPNFATTVHGLARAMARFATAQHRPGVRARAEVELTNAMIAHPFLVAGEGRACTDLMRAAKEPCALKFGADGVFVAILPKQGRGIAVKISDGATRAVDSVIAALLVRLGVLNPADPSVSHYLYGPIRNLRGFDVARLKPRNDLQNAH